MTADFMLKWALDAWKLECDFVGTMSGGTDGIKNLVECRVIGENKVQILYRLPATCGLSDVRYHNPEPYKIREDVFEFRGSELFMNGDTYPESFYMEHPWTADDAKEFVESYKRALREEVRTP